ncbi:MAG: hypothetical protein WKG07_11330 [Hymenobacter sp.]
MRADVGSDAALQAARAEDAGGLQGRIDVLVSNAALMTFEPLLQLAPKLRGTRPGAEREPAGLVPAYAALRPAPPPRGGAVVAIPARCTPTKRPLTSCPTRPARGSRGLRAGRGAREIPHTHARINAVAPGAVGPPPAALEQRPNLQSGQEKITGQVGSPRGACRRHFSAFWPRPKPTSSMAPPW